MTTANPNSSFPPEIWGTIFQNTIIERRDLLALCSVSRPFCVEAERILYASVNLRSKSKLISFCLSVILRPYLVQRMHTLTIRIPSQADIEAADVEKITKMLHLSTNLQHLHVLEDWWGIDQIPVQISLMEGHAFKIKTFENSYFPSAQLIPFLVSQPTIETLIMDYTSTPLDGMSLPNLKNLSCNEDAMESLQDLSDGYTASRNIERLRLSLHRTTQEQELPLLIKVKSCVCAELKSLNISRYHSRMEGMRLAEFVSMIASQFPDLKFLCITDFTTEAETQHHPFFTPLPTGFTRLETLILRPADMTEGLDSPHISSYEELRTDEGRLEAATRIMAALPTLKRLVILDDDVYEYKKNHDLSDCNNPLRELLYADEWLKVV